MNGESAYVFANERDESADRFDALAELYDPHTTRHIEALGPRAGWTCLEVGAGAGSIARYLAQRVAPGRVVATDRDTSRLATLAAAGVDVWRHDIDVDPLPEETFDFVHARLVLMHLADAPRALARLVGSLKRGGWLLAEEFDVGTLEGDAGDVAAIPRASVAARGAMERGGVALRLGRRLPALCREHGLVSVGGEARVCLWHGGSAGARLMRANYTTLRAAMLADGVLSPDELDRDMARLDDAAFTTLSPTMWSVWGRAAD